jgi:hypothetical protein
MIVIKFRSSGALLGGRRRTSGGRPRLEMSDQLGSAIVKEKSASKVLLLS